MHQLSKCWFAVILAKTALFVSGTDYLPVTDVITEPKTKQSVRTVEIPEFLKKEIKDFVDGHYGMPDDERLFPIVQEAVQHKMKRQIAKAGVKNIRVHDLRHPYVKPTTKNIYLYTSTLSG